jgi:hypothetical protein
VSSRSLRLRCAAGSPTSMLVASARQLSNAKADFGFRDVDAEEKERLVKDVFSKVAEKYDIMNDVMSFGTHRLWKDELVSMLGIPAAARANPNVVPRHLDVAGGTGDIAFRSLNQMLSSYGASALASEAASGPKMDSNRQIVVCDINPDMLKVGKQRAEKQYRNNGLDMVSPHFGFCVVSTLIYLYRRIRYLAGVRGGKCRAAALPGRFFRPLHHRIRPAQRDQQGCKPHNARCSLLWFDMQVLDAGGHPGSLSRAEEGRPHAHLRVQPRAESFDGAGVRPVLVQRDSAHGPAGGGGRALLPVPGGEHPKVPQAGGRLLWMVPRAVLIQQM